MGALGTHIKSYVVMNHISRRDRNKEKKKTNNYKCKKRTT